MRCRTSTRWRAVGTWLVVGFAALGSRAAVPPQALDIDYIAATIREQRQRIQVGSALIERVSLESPEAHEVRSRGRDAADYGDLPEAQHSSVRWYLDGDRVAVILDEPRPRPVAGTDLTASFVMHLAVDAREARELIRTTSRHRDHPDAEPQISHQGKIQARATMMPHGIVPGAGWWEPRWLSYHARGWNPSLPLDELLLDPTVEVEVLGTETIGARPAVHVRVTGDAAVTADFWLDRERDYVCLQSERHRTRDGDAVMTYHDEAGEVRQVGDVWMVTSLVRRLRTMLEGDEALPYRDRDGVEVIGTTTLLPPTVITITVRDLQLETAPPPEVFVVEFPDFTFVHQEGVRGERIVQYLTREEFQELWERRRGRGPER